MSKWFSKFVSSSLPASRIPAPKAPGGNKSAGGGKGGRAGHGGRSGGDSLFSYVIGIWDLDGDLLDRSGRGNDLSYTGSTGTFTSAEAKFGTQSWSVGATSGRVCPPTNADFGIGADDWCLEFFIKGGVSGATDIIFNYNNVEFTWGAGSWGWGVNLTGGTQTYIGNFTSGWFGFGNPTVTLANWTHIAYNMNGADSNCFVNGTKTSVSPRAKATYAGNVTNGATVRQGIFGGITNAYCTNMRITRGHPRYTANFTAPTAKYPAYA